MRYSLIKGVESLSVFTTLTHSHITTRRNQSMSAAGPPSAFGGGPRGPTPEQIAGFKEAGIRKTFVTDIGEALGPYIMG